ncbi:Protein Wwc2 [Manis pentadactyla]|nr:Protein Wwc2 [Manis pentadactyla]
MYMSGPYNLLKESLSSLYTDGQTGAQRRWERKDHIERASSDFSPRPELSEGGNFVDCDASSVPGGCVSSVFICFVAVKSPHVIIYGVKRTNSYNKVRARSGDA